MGTRRVNVVSHPRIIVGDEPIIENGAPTCPFCGKSTGEPDSFLALSLSVDGFNWKKTSNASCIVELYYHDAHGSIGEEDAGIGKVRLFPLMQGDRFGALGLFCSTKCFRNWINQQIDTVEQIVGL